MISLRASAGAQQGADGRRERERGKTNKLESLWGTKTFNVRRNPHSSSSPGNNPNGPSALSVCLIGGRLEDRCVGFCPWPRPFSVCRHLEDKRLRRRVAGAVQIAPLLKRSSEPFVCTHPMHVCVCVCACVECLNNYFKHGKTMAIGHM